jgi:D-psicose/D-tagatose/L-ribulose 3-epimerase
MKIGFNMLLWSTHVTDEHFPLFESLKETGYDGLEIPIFEGDPEHFRKIGQALKDNGLEATGVTVMPDLARNPIGADTAARSGAVDYLNWATDCCAAFGGKLLGGPLHQTLGHFSGHARTDEEWRHGVETLQACADYAAKTGIALSVEALNRFECYFLNLQNDAADFAKAVDRPNVGILYDTFHANIEEKHPVGAIRHNIGQINHVHISANDRGTPGKDHIPWASTFSTLKENGYDGWLTIEAFSRALPDLAAATRVWRDFFPNRDEVYEFGYQFIRNGWDAS